MKGLTEGRIVHYVIAGHEYPGADRAKGAHRPALVVLVWPRPPGSPGYVNALLFLDGSNDGAAGIQTTTGQYGYPLLWLTSIEEGEAAGGMYPHGTWHEPERVE